MSNITKTIHLLLVDDATNPKWACAPSFQPAEFGLLASKIKSEFVRRGLGFPFIGSCSVIVAPLFTGDTPEQCLESSQAASNQPVESLGVWLDCKCGLAAYHAEFLKREKFTLATFRTDPRIDLVTFVHLPRGDSEKSPMAVMERTQNRIVETRLEHEAASGLLGQLARSIGATDNFLFAQNMDHAEYGGLILCPELAGQMHVLETKRFLQHLDDTDQLACSAAEAFNWILSARQDAPEYQPYSTYLTRQQAAELIRNSIYFIARDSYVATRPSGTCATLKIILKLVSLATGVGKEEILSASRVADIAFCRHLAAYIIRCTSGRSYNVIAGQLNRDDHTTAKNSCVKIEEFMRENSFHHAFVRMLVERADECGILQSRSYAS